MDQTNQLTREGRAGQALERNVKEENDGEIKIYNGNMVADMMVRRSPP
jgi:hypothetical protein